MRILPLRGLRTAVCSAAAIALTILSVVSPAFSQVPSSTWVHLSTPVKPSARSSCSMAYDPVSQKTVLFGGYDGSRHLNDTWTFDGKNWKHIATAVAPPARAAASAAYAPTLKAVLV